MLRFTLLYNGFQCLNFSYNLDPKFGKSSEVSDTKIGETKHGDFIVVYTLT